MPEPEDRAVAEAALALRRGDPLTVLRLTDRVEVPVALALRGAALAQLDEHASATKCLAAASRAATQAGDRDTAARAELALAEIHLTRRELGEAADRLAACGDDLGGDRDNAAFVAALRARMDLYRGRPGDAAAALERAAAPDAFGRAIVSLARAEVELARGDVASCESHLASAHRHATLARHGFLLAEIEAGRERLRAPAARLVDAMGPREIDVLALARLRARRDQTVIDEPLRILRVGDRETRLATRPQLFAIVRRLAASFPEEVARDALVLALGVRRANDAHRATLRVEIVRLRELLPAGADVVATGAGFRIDLPAPIVRVEPLADHPGSDVAALLSDGQAWRAEDVARALGASPRSVQRHLAALRDDGLARTVGAGRAVRWIGDEGRAFTLLGQLSALWGVRG